MKKTFKYRIFPSRIQHEMLDSIFNSCRFLYNCALEERITSYKNLKKSVSYSEQAKYIPEIRKDIPEFSNIFSQVLQQTLMQVDSSYKNFFRRLKNKEEKVGFPRFKGKDRFRSICFPQVNIGGLKIISDKYIKVFGIDSLIKVKFHRPLEGSPKQARIIKHNDLFYLAVSCDNVPNKVLPKTNEEVGIDFGLNPFITTDDGAQHHHPKPYKTSKEKLAYRQRKLALKQKGSKNREKQKKLVGKTYQKIVNIRNNFQHQLTNQLVKQYDRIIIEKLNVKNMLESKGFAVSKANIQDASWSEFVQKLTYKAESADKLIIKVNPRNTSKKCSNCGKLKENLTLKDRIYICKYCGLTMDRDLNAAKNIRSLGTSDAIRKDLRSLHLWVEAVHVK